MPREKFVRAEYSRTFFWRIIFMVIVFWWLDLPIIKYTMPGISIGLYLYETFQKNASSKMVFFSQSLYFMAIMLNAFVIISQTGGTNSPACLSLIALPLMHSTSKQKLRSVMALSAITWLTFWVLESFFEYRFEYSYPFDMCWFKLYYACATLHTCYSVVSDLNHITEVAQKMSQHKSIFLANMSHEIRTPLTTVIGWTDLLLSSNLSDGEQTKKIISTIHHSSNHLLSIVNDILDFAKIETGGIQLEDIPFNLNELLNDVSSAFDILMQKKQITFHVDIRIPSSYVVKGDPYRLTQILNNLISNAQKFTYQGNVSLLCYERINKKGESKIKFIVRDTGIGMSEETLTKLKKVKPFTQADNSTTRVYGGTGLGLVITHTLVKLMDGNLKISSVLGQGSVFSFSLKLEKSTLKKEIPQEIKEIKPLNILLAEDNQLNQVLVKRMVETLRHTCVVASNGLEVIEKAKKEKYDLILMDIQMPHLDGMQATKYIRQSDWSCKNTKIIALTANVDSESRELVLKSGVDAFISKPITIKKLQEILESQQKEIEG